MAPIAYILIDAEYGTCKEVLECLRRTDSIEEAYKIKKGVYSIIAKIHEENDEKLNESINIVKNLKGVKHTLTEIIDDS